MQNILKYMLFMPHVHLPYMETIPNKERQLLDDSISSLSTNRGAGGGGGSCSVHRVTQPGTKRNQTPSVLEKDHFAWDKQTKYLKLLNQYKICNICTFAKVSMFETGPL